MLTIEFKINLVKPGRTITVCEASATARETGSLVCTMTATVMTIVDRPGISA